MKQNYYDKIEAYLEGDLSDVEQKAMEEAIRQDPALAREVRVWELEREALLQLRLKKVREQFAERSKHLFEEPAPEPKVVWYRRPWVRWVAAAVLVGLVGWFWPAKPSSPTQQSDEKPPIADGINDTNNPNNSTITAPVPTKPSLKPKPTQPKQLLTGLSVIPGQSTMGGTDDTDPDSLLLKAEMLFRDNGAMDACIKLIEQWEKERATNLPTGQIVYLKHMVLKTLVWDKLGQQEKAIQFLQSYANDQKPRNGAELIWRDLPKLLQMLLTRPLNKEACLEKVLKIIDDQDGSQYMNYIGPFLNNLKEWIEQQ